MEVNDLFVVFWSFAFGMVVGFIAGFVVLFYRVNKIKDKIMGLFN